MSASPLRLLSDSQDFSMCPRQWIRLGQKASVVRKSVAQDNNLNHLQANVSTILCMTLHWV